MKLPLRKGPNYEHDIELMNVDCSLISRFIATTETPTNKIIHWINFIFQELEVST